MKTNTTTQKFNLKSIMQQAWQFVRRNGYTMSEALRVAWLNAKLKVKMQAGIVRFTYRKVSGEIREAFGTLKASLVPETAGNRRENPTVQTYFDTEKGESGEWRCFKVANLLSIA